MVAYRATTWSVLPTVASQMLSEHPVPFRNYLGAEDHTRTAFEGQQGCKIFVFDPGAMSQCPQASSKHDGERKRLIQVLTVNRP